MRFFSPRERSDLLSLSPADQREAFLNCWTRKEAYVKALGDGIGRGLDRFDVTLIPGETAELLHVE